MSAIDTTNQRAETLGLAEHMRDALWRVDSAGLAPADSTGVVVAGMGGSAIGGRLARAVLGPRERKPVELVASYELPSWVDGSWTVLVSSYSGTTEEALSVWDEAAARGARLVAATTGGALGERAREAGVPVIPIPAGFQPRAAVGYATVIALEVIAGAGGGPSLREEIEAAAASVEEPPDTSELVAAIGDGIPMFIGAGLTAPVAYRFKCQVNENGNRAAFFGEIPEHDHNEIEGWQHPLVPVFLVDAQDDPRVLRRFEITAEATRRAGLAPIVLTQDGASRAERLFRLVFLGDLLSIDLAIAAGTDPVGIPAIDFLKARLAEG